MGFKEGSKHALGHDRGAHGLLLLQMRFRNKWWQEKPPKVDCVQFAFISASTVRATCYVQLKTQQALELRSMTRQLATWMQRGIEQRSWTVSDLRFPVRIVLRSG